MQFVLPNELQERVLIFGRSTIQDESVAQFPHI